MSDVKQLAHSLGSKTRTKDVVLEQNVSFESLLLPSKILKGLLETGFQKPSPIQVKALPMGRCGFDLTVQSKSGTGKTLVFSIIALDSIKLSKCETQVLILTPTREIAVQIQEVIQNIGKYFEGLEVKSFIGGLPFEVDKVKCKLCHIATGTPGRVKQLIQNNYLKVEFVKLFVLDEADKLLENSFQDDINEIYNKLPDKKQVIMCSATYPNELKSFLDNYMLSPTFVSAEVGTPLLLGLKQYVKVLKSLPNVVQQTKVKNGELLRILSSIPFTQCLIFSNYQTRAESISNFLNRNGWDVTFISSAQIQTERLNSLSDLKDFKFRVMVSTDLMARGIDAANVDLVVNYDIPVHAMTYLHRMGRAGRYGSTGICFNLASDGQELKLLQVILGSIGGESLSIPVLDDSLNIEDKCTKEFLYGVIGDDTEEFTERCKTELIQMKNKTTQNKKTIDKSLSVKSMFDDEEVVKQLVEERLLDVNTSTVLKQLAEGEMEMDKEKNPESGQVILNSPCSKLSPTSPKTNESENVSESYTNTNYILQQLVNGTPELFCEKSDEKKRKRSVASSNSPTQESLRQEEVFCKNKALFNVAKTLSNVHTDKEDAECLARYLSMLKAKECKEIDISRPPQTSIDFENIFSLAYTSQVIKGSGQWQDSLTEEEKGKLENNYKTEENENFDDEYDEDYDFELEKDIEVNYDEETLSHAPPQDTDEYSFMKWVPVGSNSSVKNIKQSTVGEAPGQGASDVDSSRGLNIFHEPNQNVVSLPTTANYHNLYSHYYEHVSNNLWQTGLNFDNVQDFDQWFWHNWQNQVASIRNFVQQKVYFEEMCYYQQNDLNPKP